MGYRGKAVSPVISTVILLGILLALAIGALYYVSTATLQAEAAGEATTAKDAYMALAQKIRSLAGVWGKTYEIVVPTKYGAANIFSSGKTLTISFDGVPLGSYSVYTLNYSISQTLYTQSPETLYGSNTLVVNGGVTPYLSTQINGNMWVVGLDTARVSYTYLYDESTPSGTRSVYAVDLVVLEKGTVEGTSAAPTVYVRLRVTNVESYSLVNVNSIEVSLDGNSTTISPSNTANLIIVTITHITVDIVGGGGA